MKNYNNILVVVMLFCANNVFAGMRPLPAVPVKSFTMDSILQGALDTQGNDFAWKTNQIYRYNYSKAMKRGSANLNLALMKDIADIGANPSFDQATKIRLLQSSINNLYPILEGYRSLDAQSMSPVSIPMTTMPVSPAPTTMMRLSLESILNGALGQDYGTKAKDVYNSGVAFYVDDMTRGINSALNAYYPNEAARANAIKLSIDRNYNFLANYRKNNQPVVQTPVYAPAQPMPTMLSLQSILNGALGEPYTAKANEIYRSGTLYADALVKDLNRDVNANYAGYEDRRIAALKASIDKNYNFLMNYRKNNQPVVQTPVYAPAPPMALSLQSILNGALGEPYTSKANEIYNSGVTMYVNDLNKRINIFSSGRDAANNIKNSIDTVYNFLQNYRRNNPY